MIWVKGFCELRCTVQGKPFNVPLEINISLYYCEFFFVELSNEGRWSHFEECYRKSSIEGQRSS